MDVVGYTYDCDRWCADCLQDAGINPSDDEVSALFDYDESDCPEHCGSCGEFLGGSLTDRGLEDLKEAYREGNYRAPRGGPSDVFRQYMSHYLVDWHFIWTFAGLVDPDGDPK
jgi:hypothetical protein